MQQIDERPERLTFRTLLNLRKPLRINN